MSRPLLVLLTVSFFAVVPGCANVSPDDLAEPVVASLNAYTCGGTTCSGSCPGTQRCGATGYREGPAMTVELTCGCLDAPPTCGTGAECGGTCAEGQVCMEYVVIPGSGSPRAECGCKPKPPGKACGRQSNWTCGGDCGSGAFCWVHEDGYNCECISYADVI